jgi:hypothetical protein
MMSSVRFILSVGLLTVFVTLLAPAGSSQAQVVIGDWPDLYAPFTLHHYRLTMTEANWDTIRFDATHDIEVPTLFSAQAEGGPIEGPILIAVRRKSATAFPNEADPQKVSLKLDINDFTDQDEFGDDFCEEDGGFTSPTCVETWHDVKKLSLENGDDVNVVTEGFAWYLHGLASGRYGSPSSLDYKVGLFNWVTLEITLIDNPVDMNIVDTLGPWVYVNVEQPDKTYLVNRGLWEGSNDTWFYEYDERYEVEYEEAPEDVNGDPINSPGFFALNYKPFQQCRSRRDGCDEQPSDEDFVADLNKWINMDGMLTYNAVAAFHWSPDDLFPKAKNFLHTDYTTDIDGVPLRKREYVQWDLDSTFAGHGFAVDADIFNQQDRRKFGLFENFIIGNATFRDQYTEIMRDLLLNVFTVADLQADLDAFEISIGAALAADPHNALPDSVADTFTALRQFIADRHDNVLGQLPPPPP